MLHHVEQATRGQSIPHPICHPHHGMLRIKIHPPLRNHAIQGCFRANTQGQAVRPFNHLPPPIARLPVVRYPSPDFSLGGSTPTPQAQKMTLKRRTRPVIRWHFTGRKVPRERVHCVIVQPKIHQSSTPQVHRQVGFSRLTQHTHASLCLSLQRQAQQAASSKQYLYLPPIHTHNNMSKYTLYFGKAPLDIYIKYMFKMFQRYRIVPTPPNILPHNVLTARSLIHLYIFSLCFCTDFAPVLH